MKTSRFQILRNCLASAIAGAMTGFLLVVILAFLSVGPSACTTAQLAATQATLSTPQAKMIESAGEVIAQAALTAYAPAFSWTLPLAVNAASGLLADQTNAQVVATVQSTVNSVANIPAYAPIATQIGNVLAAVAPTSPAQQVAATQALAQAIASNLPK